MSFKQQQPARHSGRQIADGTFEDVSFARRTAKRRRARELAKASRKRNRK